MWQSGDSNAEQAFVEKSKELLKEMNKYVKAPSMLKEYSPWLSAFQASHYQQQLELPGSI